MTTCIAFIEKTKSDKRLQPSAIISTLLMRWSTIPMGSPHSTDMRALFRRREFRGIIRSIKLEKSSGNSILHIDFFQKDFGFLQLPGRMENPRRHGFFTVYYKKNFSARGKSLFPEISMCRFLQRYWKYSLNEFWKGISLSRFRLSCLILSENRRLNRFRRIIRFSRICKRITWIGIVICRNMSMQRWISYIIRESSLLWIDR